MRLQESGKIYLETILILSRKSNTVRSIDISDESFEAIKLHLKKKV